MTRTRPFPYSLLISGTRKTSNTTGEFTGFHLARVRLMSNVRAIGQVPFGKHVLLAPLSTAAAFEIGLLGSFGILAAPFINHPHPALNSPDTSRNSRASPKAARGDGLRARPPKTAEEFDRETADPMSPRAVRQSSPRH